MGWRLVAEILDHCPDIKYREFRVLIALALDARDETRQGMPGQELLTLRGNCGMRATKYAMASLARRGLIKTARRPAPGVRAVYEIVPMAGTGATMPARVTGAKYKPTHAKTKPTGAGIVAPTQSLELSQITQSSLSRARAALEAAGATEREIDFVIDTIKNNPKIRSKAAYLRSAIANGDADELIAEARAYLAQADRKAAADAEFEAKAAAGIAGRFGSVASLTTARARECEHGTPGGSRANCALCRARHLQGIAEAKARLARIQQEKRS